MVASDAAAKLNAKDAETRGEAAIVVAATGDRRQEAKLLELARDPAPATRHRALVGLGLLATPTAVQHLEFALADVDGRTGDDGVAAAFALGLVPPERVGTSVARTLALFPRGSWKRQHDVLAALLLGMSRHPARDERRALRLLLDDDANRAPDVRARLLRLLLPIDGTFTTDDLERLLRRGHDDERLAVLDWLAACTANELQPWLETLTRIAERDDDPRLRTAALRALTRTNHLPGLELAARRLRSADPAECRQAIASMLAIGGASTRGALEQHLIAERDAVRLGALLEGFAAPPSDRLLDRAVEVATDAEQPFRTRLAAAELVARSRPKGAAPILRDLFRVAPDADARTRLARALDRVADEPTALDRLVNRPVDLTHHPESFHALLAAGHGEAQRHVLGVLQDPKRPAEDVRTALKAWRKAMVLTPPSGAPEALQRILR